MFVEGIGLFFCRWNALAIVGEDGFVGVGCVCEFVVEGLDTAPYLRWVGSEVDFG